MNIFYTDPCPKKCASYLDDKRVIKMALETAQLLSTAQHISGATVTYKPTHINHPCSVWVRSSLSNYQWAYEHFLALLAEYTRRFGKVHACSRLIEELRTINLPDIGLTEHVNCTPYNLPVIDSYRAVLKDKWAKDKREPTWR